MSKGFKRKECLHGMCLIEGFVMGSIALLGFLLTALVAVRPVDGAILYGCGTFAIGPSEFQCKSFAFSPAFSSADVTAGIHVQISLYMTDLPGPTYEPAVGWVENVTPSGFTSCVETSAEITSTRAVTLQWMAFAGNPENGLAGTAVVPLFTAGTECVDVDFIGVKFSKPPHVFVTAVHIDPLSNSHDAASVWAEGATRYDFKICLRELKNFDGVHQNIKVDWLALKGIPSGWAVPIGTSVTLPNTEDLTASTSYSFCKDVTFSNEFYATPVLITTAHHTTNLQTNPKAISPDNNAITEWIESVNKTGFKVCMKDIQPFDGHHDPVDIEYLAIGNLDPCIEVTCDFFAVCQAFGPKDARCICPHNCATYENQRCGEDNVTYTNECTHQKAMCDQTQTIGIRHMGPCFPFILHRGRVLLTLDTTDVQCNTVPYAAPTFLPHYHVHVQASINYYSHAPSSPYIHDAAVVWAENVGLTNFTVCALKAGRTDRATPDGGNTYIDYIAYQGSPAGAVAGEESMENWWDGTYCKSVTLPSGKFSSKPYIITSAQHAVIGQKHDAATTWVEDVTTSSFRICLREMQNFDGLHSSISVNWMAYETLPSTFLAEKRTLAFPNLGLPLAADNNAFCQVMALNGNYTSPPTMIVTSGHSTSQGVIPEYNSIASWVEVIKYSKPRKDI
ncbi:predicted protein [Nematostella vectensis]|uniref:Kazal-like domain-containing protein n=1 Tax=Nematostella vectensis TaxID=45351 RepID=A7SJ03_NEMVE|nr:predicted protein [Nematostella vectensis]|eukprot:XP_001628398.1 predicted protein [Nematostella vectensis]